MQFLVMSQRNEATFADADFDAVIPAETARVRELYGRGAVRQIWLRDDVRGACFLAEADTMAEMRAIVAALPMAERRMSEFTIIPLRPYGGFAS